MKILLQGAMPEEVDYFMEFFKPSRREVIAEYVFYFAEYKNQQIIISLTNMGEINASIATTIALICFKPDLVINQGCAGSHDVGIKTGDIVIGEKSVYMNTFMTPSKQEGQGSNSLEWVPFKENYYFFSTKAYVNFAKEVKSEHKVVCGTLGSGDNFSREIDRIKHLKKLFGESCEDMESVSVLKACELFGVNKVAFRIISNNELLDSSFEIETCKEMQKFVIDFVEILILKRQI